MLLFELQIVTISYVLPCVLNLYNHLEDCATPCFYVTDVIDKLTESLTRRFQGILIRTNLIDGTIIDKTPFANAVYMHSTFLDPNWGLVWLNLDVPADRKSKVKEELRSMCNYN